MKKTSIIIVSMVLIACCVGSESRPYSRFYAGEWRNFRANLVEAEKVLVYPNDDALRQVLLKPSIEKVHIAFIPNETENAFYFVSTFEITNKLVIIYRSLYQGERDMDVFTTDDNSTCLAFYSRKVSNVLSTKCFRSVSISSIDEAFEISEENEPVILLLGPSQTNRTMVDVREYVVKVEGSDFSEVERSFTDLDLSTDKLLITLMEA